MEARKLAIVILNWNGSDMMRKYLPTVIANSSEDIIVADNASTDDSIHMLSEEFPNIRTIVLDKNYGFAEGYNRALEQIKDEYEYYLLLNSDIEIKQKDWLLPLLSYMDSHPECAACQPKLLSLRRPDEFEYAGAAGGYLDKYGYPFCRGRIMDTVEKDNNQYDTIRPILWATGACLLIRAADYWAAGGLDSRYFAHMEEIDLCWRLRNSGRTIVCVPQSTAYHLGGASLNYGNPRKTFLNFRNSLWTLYKNLPQKELHSVLSMRFLLDMVAAAKFLLTLQASHAWAVIRANYIFYTTLKEWRNDRNKIQSSRRASSIPERTNYSILFRYYVKGNKTYNQL